MRKTGTPLERKEGKNKGRKSRKEKKQDVTRGYTIVADRWNWKGVGGRQ